MKSGISLGFLTVVLAIAQEKTTQQPAVRFKQAATARAGGVEATPSYRAEDLKILGDLNYGQTSRLVSCSASPRYRAFVFSGYGGDSVDVTALGRHGKAFVALADSSLNQIASGDTHLRLSLPYRGPDIEVWYIIFRETENKPALFTVRVNKIGNTSARADTSASGTQQADQAQPRFEP